MAVFTYTAIARDRSVERGTLVADTPRQARDQLRARGMTVQQVAPRGAGAAVAERLRLAPSRRHSAKTIAFIRELSTLLAVGIPLLQALQTLARQNTGGFRSVLLTLQDRVASGASLADAMREQPVIFDELSVSITEVGESAGTLDVVLDRLADFKERSAALRGRIGTALIYPCIVLVVAVGVSILLMTFVVPKLLGPLLEAGQPIPFATRVVKAASDGLLDWWWLLLIGIAAVTAGLAAVLNTVRGKRLWDRTQLAIPLLGGLVRKQAIARFAVVIATLLRSGVVFVRALQIARRTTRNSVMSDALARCEAAVSRGADLSEALEDTNAFPPMVVQIFAVGQQSGRLEEMLDRLAADYDRQVATLTTRLTAVLEPILILVMVVLVGFIAFATILPMLQAADVL